MHNAFFLSNTMNESGRHEVCGPFPTHPFAPASSGAGMAAGPSSPAQPARFLRRGRSPRGTLARCPLKTHGPRNPPHVAHGPRNPPSRPAGSLHGSAHPAGPVQSPARFAGPVRGVESPNPACGALCSERRGMSRRTGKSRSSRRALARFRSRRRAATGFARISPAKRASETPFPVRRARSLHFVQAGGGAGRMARGPGGKRQSDGEGCKQGK